MKMENGEILTENKKNYDTLYSEGRNFLEYPADWIIRFWNMYMRKNIPNGIVLDYGCGSGNNSVFFLKKGYWVYGMDVSKEVLPLVKKNLENNNLPANKLASFSIMSPDSIRLPFDDNSLDLILSNQVLYYLPTKEHVKELCKEFSRCLKPNGAVFFTMMSMDHYYIKYHTKQVLGNIHDIQIDDSSHRLSGVRELIYVVRDEEELKELFDEFECISAGYFDSSMFDMRGTKHWIFVGVKKRNINLNRS